LCINNIIHAFEKMIKFPAKKYTKSGKYFENYIAMKDILLKIIDQKVFHNISQYIGNLKFNNNNKITKVSF